MIAGKRCTWLTGIILLLFPSLYVLAQQQQVRFRPISFREGLAQSPISCIFQDKQGFIWIGNWKGLTRYDGIGFRNFKHIDNDSSSISNNRVNSILQDDHLNLWIGTANGINIFNPRTEIFRSITVPGIKGGKNYGAALASDKQKGIWVSTFGGIKLVRDYTLIDIPEFSRQGSSVLYSGITFTIFNDSRNLMWVGTKQGPLCFNPVSRKIVALPLALKDNEALMKAKVLVVREDKNGNIWMGTESSGVFMFDSRSGICERFIHQEGNEGSLCSDWVKDILIGSDGKVWIGTRGGLSQWQNGNRFDNFRHDSTDPGSITDSSVWSLLQDDSGNIWLGTFAGGINLLQHGGNNFANIGERTGRKMGLNHPVVNAVVEDPDGSLWIGTYGGGINHINLKTGAYNYYSVRHSNQDRPTNGVKSLSQDNKGNLWIGTLDGLFCFNKQTHVIRDFSFPVTDGKLSENLINAILVDEEGVWAGTNGGGLRFISNQGQITTFRHDGGDPTSLSDNFVTSLLKDKKGNLWVATQNGLNYYDVRSRKFTSRYRRTKRFPLSHNTILCLFIDSKDRLWIGTEGGGLDYFDHKNGRIYPLNASLQFPDDVIHAITEDKKGNLWVSTDNGIVRIVIRGIKGEFDVSKLSITQYNADNGLASNQFSTNAGCCARSGMVLFGGVNGLTLFQPETIVKNRFIPKVVLTGFSIRNNPIQAGEEGSPLKEAINYSRGITLDYDQRFIGIKFAALNFINPANNQYAYKLEGLTNKEDWHFAGNESSATYTNLGPGKYTFMVKAANNDGVWNERPVTLSIRVLPPWWMTWWAYLLYTVIVASVIVAVFRFLYIRAKLRRDLFYEQLQNERQQELYQMKLNFFTNVSHEIRTPLTLIVGPLEKVMNMVLDNNSVRRQLLTVRNNADRLMRLVTELLDFRKVETGNMKLHFSECNIIKFAGEIFLSFQGIAQSRDIDYRFRSDLSELPVCFDKDQMEKVFFNLLSNAFKFTPDGGRIRLRINIAVRDEEEWVDVRIEDNGRGIPPESQEQLFNVFFQADQSKSHLGTGIGLALSKSIVELHKGELKVNSVPSIDNHSGETAFIVSLKTGRDHLAGVDILPEYLNSENPVHYRIQSEAAIPDDFSSDIAGERKYTVQIIEDNQEVRNFIAESLGSQYLIHESADGIKGLEDAFGLIPDLIISDVMMPGMDGLEVCRSIKTDERTNHIPVVLLTARAAFIHQVNGLENGADAYITKPFSIHILALQIRNILDAKEAIRKKFSREVILQPKNIAITSPEEKFLHKLMDIVERNMENDRFGVPEMVDEIGMSKSVLYKKVQALTGMPVADYIKSARLQRAAQLFSQNKLSIAEVAFAVGFNDRKYFSKEFRKQYGMSPTEYISKNCTEAISESGFRDGE